MTADTWRPKGGGAVLAEIDGETVSLPLLSARVCHRIATEGFQPGEDLQALAFGDRFDEMLDRLSWPDFVDLALLICQRSGLNVGRLDHEVEPAPEDKAPTSDGSQKTGTQSKRTSKPSSGRQTRTAAATES